MRATARDPRRGAGSRSAKPITASRRDERLQRERAREIEGRRHGGDRVERGQRRPEPRAGAPRRDEQRPPGRGDGVQRERPAARAAVPPSGAAAMTARAEHRAEQRRPATRMRPPAPPSCRHDRERTPARAAVTKKPQQSSRSTRRPSTEKRTAASSGDEAPGEAKRRLRARAAARAGGTASAGPGWVRKSASAAPSSAKSSTSPQRNAWKASRSSLTPLLSADRSVPISAMTDADPDRRRPPAHPRGARGAAKAQRLRRRGFASDGAEAIAEAGRLQPDVVLLDLSMPDIDGLAALPRIREAAPDCEVVVLTASGTEENLLAAIRARRRRLPAEERAARAHRRASCGASPAARPPSPARRAPAARPGARAAAARAGVPDAIAAALSARELEVLLLLDHHLGTEEIAQRLFISEHTVRSHVKSLLRKLGVSSRREALERLASPGRRGVRPLTHPFWVTRFPRRGARTTGPPGRLVGQATLHTFRGNGGYSLRRTSGSSGSRSCFSPSAAREALERGVDEGRQRLEVVAALENGGHARAPARRSGGRARGSRPR